MEKPDARFLSIETQTYLRQQAIRLRAQGKRVCEIRNTWGFIAAPCLSGGGSMNTMEKQLCIKSPEDDSWEMVGH